MGSFHVCLFALTAFFIAFVEPFSDSRLELVKISNDGDTQVSIVLHNKNGLCRWTVYKKALLVEPQIRSSSWHNLPLPNGLTAESSPSAISVSNVTALVFIQASNGQVYMSSVTKEEVPKFGGWLMVGGTKLAFNDGSKLNGMDNVKAAFYANKPYVIARSRTNSSKCYWTCLADNKWSGWSLIGGGSVALLTDVSVVYNSFSKYLEAFAVMTDGYMYRTWQTGFSDWHSWDKTGYYAPKSVHAPVAHEMDTNMFNGRINVFVHGTDGKMHHIWQTTCDNVPNPWGWCTWSTWNTIGESVPPAMNVANTLSIANNMHLGIEIFTVDKRGKLNYMWQSERHGKWHSWKIVTETQSAALATIATVTDDKTGWWIAYGLDASDNVFFIQEKRSIVVSPTKIVSGDAVDIKWSVPTDQATHMDWIGVYQKGVDSHEYVDYYYVGGTQNPYKDPVPNGELKFSSYLPAGIYEYRYLVNKRFVPAVQSSLEVTKGPSDVKWVQVFRGLFTGLHLKNVSVETCVKDAEKTVDYFEKAFAAFEDREIYKGLHLVGYGLSGATLAMKDCHIDSAIIAAIEKFVKDLISCIEGSCVHFAIDALKEVVILFENIYEIYGDIRGASNSFKIKAYEQGAYCVGRAVYACTNLRLK
ncbi:uncharacterized protein LOC135689548 isoform X1 [Rhopilema esculentum]|uniref:uncharacterized protein LOC135689548 isoform X1 n=1 Tax=Rhopilema esculentum TaxID=499914 RepID=UPI0031E0C0C4